MATKTYCVCGNKINRKYSPRTKKATSGKGSVRIRRTLGTTTHLCRSCMSEFLRSRPSHDDPTSGGTFTLCNFCNDTMERHNLTAFWCWLTTPTIFRWVGKLRSTSKGNAQTVCMECRRELNDFIEEKKAETGDN